MSRPITFTKRELDLIADMCAIAGASEGVWGQGDYIGESWMRKDVGKTHAELQTKIGALLRAKEPKSKTLAEVFAEEEARKEQTK